MRSPEHAEHGVVGPAPRPGPWGRRRTRSRLLLAGALVALASWCLTPIPRPTGTEALFTSRAAPQVNSLEGGSWTPDPPTACGDPSAYAGVVYGTLGDDMLNGSDRPQIIMGLAGNDSIVGGNAGDCLVGGPGNDRVVGGSAKDILAGGAGDDYLDGADDVDVCDGGDGQNELLNCDASVPPVAPQPLIQHDPANQPDPVQADPTPVAPPATAAPDPTPQEPAAPAPDPSTPPDPSPTTPAPDPSTPAAPEVAP
jgi:hypothetical protein